MQKTIETTCKECGITFSAETIFMDDKVIFQESFCPACGSAHKNQRELEEKAVKNRKLEESWKILCPPLYRESDMQRIHLTYAKQAANWLYQATGLGLVGRSGYGKTRASYAILRRFHFEGMKCAAFSSCEFSKLTVDQFSDDKEIKAKAIEAIKRAYDAKLLLIDDIGKARMTDRGEMELYAILEHRANQMLPVIWTANAKSEELLTMFSRDRGEPTMRRLKDFSTIVAQWV